jgi:hypothetical protein
MANRTREKYNLWIAEGEEYQALIIDLAAQSAYTLPTKAALQRMLPRL